MQLYMKVLNQYFKFLKENNYRVLLLTPIFIKVLWEARKMGLNYKELSGVYLALTAMLNRQNEQKTNGNTNIRFLDRNNVCNIVYLHLQLFIKNTQNMKPTGQCLKDFEKYFKKRFTFLPSKEVMPFLGCFYDLDNSMQYGVLVDFFDSVVINIEITNDNKEIKTFWVDIDNKQVDEVELNTRPEAREQAILKANEIYNEQK